MSDLPLPIPPRNPILRLDRGVPSRRRKASWMPVRAGMTASWSTALQRLCLGLLLVCGAAPAALADCAGQAPSPHCGATPQPGVDAEGTLWVSFVDGETVYLARSLDGSASFAPAVAVNATPEPVYADGENRPALAFGAQGEIFVAWTRKGEAAYSGDIRFARSLDGQAFEAPRTVNDDGLLTSHRFVAMAPAPDGTLYLAWLDKRDQIAALEAGQDYVGAALYYTLSQDGGLSFAPNRKVADHSCECCRLALAPGRQGGMEVLWRHVFAAGTVRDHAIATLGSEGSGTLRRATEDHWELEGCPHHGPAMAGVEGGHQLAWFSNGSGAQGVLTGFHDAASGRTLRVHSLDARPGAGHPAVAVQDGGLSVVWKVFDGERMAVQLAQSVDGGRHWGESRVLASTAGASDHPLLLTRDGALFLSWQSAEEGYRLLPLPHPTSGEQP